MIRNVRMVCELLSAFNIYIYLFIFKRTTCTTKLKNETFRKKRNRENIYIHPKALLTLSLTFHLDFFSLLFGGGQDGTEQNLNYSLRIGGV